MTSPTAIQLLRNIVDRASLTVCAHGNEYLVPPDDINAARLWLSSQEATEAPCHGLPMDSANDGGEPHAPKA